MYYRYEILVNDKRYGLFVGLKEIGFDEITIDELTEYFNDYLPIPWFYLTNGKNARKNVYAYFTEYGNEKFKKYINNIIETVEKCGYNIVKLTQNSVGTKRLIYEDKYQALIKKKETK